MPRWRVRQWPKGTAPEAIERRTDGQRSPLGEVWVQAKAIHVPILLKNGSRRNRMRIGQRRKCQTAMLDARCPT